MPSVPEHKVNQQAFTWRSQQIFRKSVSFLPEITSLLAPDVGGVFRYNPYSNLREDEVKFYIISKINSSYKNSYIYIGCPRRTVPDFGRVFLMLKYTDTTQNTYVQSCIPLLPHS
jgi:hypothetical protein